jgi:hypothetical protein
MLSAELLLNILRAPPFPSVWHHDGNVQGIFQIWMPTMNSKGEESPLAMDAYMFWLLPSPRHSAAGIYHQVQACWGLSGFGANEPLISNPPKFKSGPVNE